MLFQDILLGSGDLREVEGEKLQRDIIGGCGSICLQLCILSLTQICRTEGSQIIVCPCSSVLENRQRNPDAFRSLTFRGHCVYMLKKQHWFCCSDCSFDSINVHLQVVKLCFLQVRTFLTRDFHHYILLIIKPYPLNQKKVPKKIVLLMVCLAPQFFKTRCLVTNQLM